MKKMEKCPGKLSEQGTSGGGEKREAGGANSFIEQQMQFQPPNPREASLRPTSSVSQAAG